MNKKHTEERVRFCNQCNAVVGWYAEFCDSCGGSVGEEKPKTAPAPPAIDIPSIEKELFKAHLRLIHRFKEQAVRLGRSVERIEASLQELRGRRRNPENKRALLGLSERLLGKEQEWEDIQRAYNTQSEGVEEEYLERIDQLEADIEMSPEHQAALEREGVSLHGILEALEQRIRDTGRLLDVVTARYQSRVLGLSTGPRGTLTLGILCFVLAAAGAAWGIVIAQLPPRDLGLALLPAWVGLCALFLNARAKSL
jgi:hypothetical protein